MPHPVISLPRGALLALVSALLSACATVGPDYQTPNAELPARYAAASAVAARNTTLAAPALDDWWLGFQDEQLTQLVQRVLAQNLDIAAAKARVDAAHAVAQAAGAAQLPSGTLDASAAKLHQSTEGPIGKIASAFPGYERSQSLYDLDAAASWDLDLFGGLKRAAQAARADAEAAQAQQAAVQVSVVAEAADAYLRIRGLQARLLLAQQQIETDTHLLSLVQQRLQGGIGANRELAQAQAQLAQARSNLPPLRTELALHLNRLDVLMGAAPGTYAAALTAAPAPINSVPAIGLAQGPADLLRRRPDVIAAERRLAASNARIGSAIAQYYPNVSLGAVLGLVSLNGGTVFSNAAFEPQAVAGLHWRLFDFGRVDAEVAQAKGANAAALADYRGAMLHATEDVENALVTLTQLEDQRGALLDEVSARTRARADTEDAYRGGVASLFEVLQEDRDLLVSRDQLARVQADDARAAVAAFRAMGGGWQRGAA